MPLASGNLARQSSPQAQPHHHPNRRALPILIVALQKVIANPVRLSETPPRYDMPPPLLGQHTEEVLTSLGLDKAAIEALRGKGPA